SVTVNSSRNTVSGRVPPGRRRRRQFITSGYLVEAASLEALAGKISVDAAGLRETVRQHNRFAETGEDQEFGKGSTEFDRHNGDPQHAPNPCLGRIATPPYYAMAVYPSTLGTSVGLRADPDGRVLTEMGEPIAGLFVCGNDMASIMRGHYPGPGITLGPALVFAYRAAMAIRGDRVGRWKFCPRARRRRAQSLKRSVSCFPSARLCAKYPVLFRSCRQPEKQRRSARRQTRERNVHALERNYDGIIIGAGHHGLVLGAYLAKAGLDILVVERRLDYGGGLSTKEATEPGFYHNLHSINHFHISETPWFKDLGLGERVTYITPRYEFGQAHSDGTALVLGRDLEETVANIARFSNKD